MSPSSRIAFRLLAHVCLLQYSRSSNMLAFMRTWHIFLQDVHVLTLHGPKGWKIIIDQIIAKNWKGFWHGQVLIIQITPTHFFSSWESFSSWCRGKFNLFLFYLYIIFFYINLKVLCDNVMEGNTKVLDEKLNLLWPGLLKMLLHMLLAFHINSINSKCYIQHTYYSRWKSQDHVMIIWD